MINTRQKAEKAKQLADAWKRAADAEAVAEKLRKLAEALDSEFRRDSVASPAPK